MEKIFLTFLLLFAAAIMFAIIIVTLLSLKDLADMEGYKIKVIDKMMKLFFEEEEENNADRI